MAEKSKLRPKPRPKVEGKPLGPTSTRTVFREVSRPNIVGLTSKSGDEPRKAVGSTVHPHISCNVSVVAGLDTHVKLREWAEKMKFLPGGKFSKMFDYPTRDDFKRLCRGETISVWEHVMKCIRPREEVAHIRRMLTEKNLRELALRKEALEHKLVEKKAKAAKKEEDFRRLLKDAKENSYNIEVLKNRIEEARMKVALYKLRSDDLESKISVTTAYVESLWRLTASLRSEHRKTPDEAAMSILRSCLARVCEYRGGTDLHPGPPAERAELQRHISEATSSLTAEQIWLAMAHLQDELDTQVGDLSAKSLTVDLDDADITMNAANAAINRMEVLYMQLVHKAAATSAENNRLTAEIDEAKRNCLSLISERLSKSSNLNMMSLPDHSTEEVWLNRRLDCVRWEASCRAIDTKLAEIRAETSHAEANSASYETSRLSVNEGRDKLRRIDERIAYNMQLFRSMTEGLDMTCRQISVFLTEAARADLVQRTSTMVAETRGALAQEIREFAHFPLDAVGYVCLPSGKRVLSSNLLVNYVKALPLLRKDFDTDVVFTTLAGAPTLPVEDIVFRLHEKRVYSNRLRWALEDRVQLRKTPLYDVAAVRRRERELVERTRVVMDALRYEARECEGLVATFADTVRIFAEHPAQLAIGEGCTEMGHTLSQWRQKYEDVYVQVMELPPQGRDDMRAS